MTRWRGARHLQSKVNLGRKRRSQPLGTSAEFFPGAHAPYDLEHAFAEAQRIKDLAPRTGGADGGKLLDDPALTVRSGVNHKKADERGVFDDLPVYPASHRERLNSLVLQ